MPNRQLPCVSRIMFAAALMAVVAVWADSSALAQYAEGNGLVPVDGELYEGFASITPDQAEQWLDVLAGDTFAGRGTGQAGYTRAAHWVAGRLAEFGLEPVGDQGTYFQMVPMIRRMPDMDGCRITGPNELRIEGAGKLGFDRFTDQPQVESSPVFITASGTELTLPQDLDLRDRIVFFSVDDSAATLFPRLLARSRPAAAIRVIAGQPGSISQVVFPGRRRQSTSFSGTILNSAALELAEGLGGDSSWVEPVEGELVVHEAEQSITLSVPVREQQSAVPNVVAYLPGSNPELEDEYIVIGAHLDHLGQRGGSVYPGADDNGSGSTAILSIARAMALNPKKPERGVLFIWFAAEEMGLVGSRYYVEHPLLPLENMTCMLNIDMVGRNEETESETSAENEGHLHLIGSRRGDAALHELILSANESIGFEFEFDMESVFGRSDQINFYNKGVPSGLPVWGLSSRLSPAYGRDAENQLQENCFGGPAVLSKCLSCRGPRSLRTQPLRIRALTQGTTQGIIRTLFWIAIQHRFAMSWLPRDSTTRETVSFCRLAAHHLWRRPSASTFMLDGRLADQ